MGTEESLIKPSDKPRREDLVRITEDPYFQYLVEKKARSQTRAFLATAGSIIAAVILYGGWEFKSAKAEIDKQKGVIQEESEKAKKNSEDVGKANQTAKTQIEEARMMLRFAEQYRDESLSRSNAMVSAAERNFKTTSDLQTAFLSSQERLQHAVSVTVDRTVQSSKMIDESLKKLDLADIDGKVSTIAEHASTVDKIVERIGRREEEIDRAGKNIGELAGRVGTLASQLNDVKSIQSNIQKARLNELVLLTTGNERTLNLRDPSSPTSYTIRFNCSGIGSRKILSISIRVLPSDTLEETGTSVDINVVNERVSPKRHEISGTPFVFRFDFAYHAIMSDDFVALRVLAKD